MSATLTISKPQQVQIDLMRMASFNEFDGDRVADSLLEHRELWQGFILDRAAYFEEYARQNQGARCDPIDLIRLRDIAAGYWNVDTLYVLPAAGAEDTLEALAQTWDADEIMWQDNPNAGRVLRVWWD